MARPTVQCLQPANEKLALVDHLGREMIVESEEEFFVAHHFFAPGGSIEGLQLVERFLWERFETLPIQIRVARHPADRRFAPSNTAVGTVDDPLQHAHVFAEAGPQEVAIPILAEPVYVEDA